jgi:hypothetical protein
MAVCLAAVALRDVITVVWFFNFYLEVVGFFNFEYIFVICLFFKSKKEVGAALCSIYALHIDGADCKVALLFDILLYHFMR